MSEPETYPPPLDRLNAVDLDETESPADVDYLALGIGPEHIPDLIDIAIDRRYETETLPVAWASIHARRALGALRAVEAVEPLTALLSTVDHDDWILEDLPRALGLIGAPAVPVVTRYLAQNNHPLWGRIAAARALETIGKTHPDVRDDCVAALTGQLRLSGEQDAELNAFLVSSLIDLTAVESAPVIQAAFDADDVDLSVTGDWEDVQVELGLLPARLTPRPRYRPSFELPAFELGAPERISSGPRATADRRAAEKRRRKLAKQSRRRNRRRK